MSREWSIVKILLRILRTVVAFSLAVWMLPLTKTWDRLDEYVTPTFYRPAHFLWFVAFAVVASHIWTRPRFTWNRQDKLYTGGFFLVAGVLWATELGFDFRLGHWSALAVYCIPLVWFVFLRLVRRGRSR